MSDVLEVGFRVVLILVVIVGTCWVMYLHDRLTEPERRRQARRTEMAWTEEAVRTGRFDPVTKSAIRRPTSVAGPEVFGEDGGQ